MILLLSHAVASANFESTDALLALTLQFYISLTTHALRRKRLPQE